MGDHDITLIVSALGGLGALQLFTLGLIAKHVMVDCPRQSHSIELIGSKVIDLTGEVGGPDTGLRGDVKRMSLDMAEVAGYSRRVREEKATGVRQ